MRDRSPDEHVVIRTSREVDHPSLSRGCQQQLKTDPVPVLDRLRVISTPVKTIDDGLRTLIADLFEQMYDAPGIGLAV